MGFDGNARGGLAIDNTGANVDGGFGRGPDGDGDTATMNSGFSETRNGAPAIDTGRGPGLGGRSTAGREFGATGYPRNDNYRDDLLRTGATNADEAMSAGQVRIGGFENGGLEFGRTRDVNDNSITGRISGTAGGPLRWHE